MASSTNSATTYCLAGCGFFGNSAFEGFCSKCFNQKKAQQSANANNSAPHSAPVAPTPATKPQPVAVPTPAPSSKPAPVSDAMEVEPVAPAAVVAAETSAPASPAKPKSLVCGFSGCKKRIPLTATVQPCRCGGSFCPSHRHDFQHNCTVDLKSAQKQAIRDANPVVAPSKLSSI